MKRRNFIVLSGIGIIGAGYTIWHLKENKKKESLNYPQYLSMILDSAAIISIGRDYLAIYPTHKNKNKLVELLNGSLNNTKDLSGLKSAIENDFEKGNALVLGGWVVAITEARQCALYSLDK